MRVWLKDSERRPDPMPVVTDDRVAIYVGLGLWLMALIGLLVVPELLGIDHAAWRVATCLIGLGLGVMGLVYTRYRNKA